MTGPSFKMMYIFKGSRYIEMQSTSTESMVNDGSKDVMANNGNSRCV